MATKVKLIADDAVGAAQIDSSASPTFTDLTLTGNLTVQGTTTTLDTANLNVEDKNITLNYGTGDTSSGVDGAGITIQDAVDASNDASITWTASNDRFNFSHTAQINHDGVSLVMDGTSNASRTLLFRSVGTGEGIVKADGNMHLLQEDASKYMRFSTANTERMRIDANGHVGIGRVPESDYYSGIKALALGNGPVIYASTTGNPNLTFNDNLFINSAGNNEYQTSNPGTRLEQFNGTLTFSTAPSGTAGQTATLTERFRIAADGSVGIGNASPTATLDVNGSIKLDGNYPVGSQNVAIGDTAFDSVTTASNNTMIGHAAGTAITTSNFNTVVGAYALDAQQSGGRNVAIGYAALSTDTTGGRSVAIGWNALGNQNLGSDDISYNVAIGYNAMGDSTYGLRNVAIGHETLDANTSGNDNTAVGQAALSTSQTADKNTAVGRAALNACTSDNNVAVGYHALLNASTGTQNNAVGSNALADLTTGNYNVAIGQAALSDLIGGSSNTAVGDNAMQFGTANNYCVAVGENAGRYMTGSQNTALGCQAMDNSSCTSSNNTAVGYEAMGKLTSGGDNVAMGRAAQLDLTTGGSNTSVGVEAMENNQGGHENSCFGKHAGRNLTSGSSNTFIGHSVNPSSGSTSNANGLGYSLTCQDNYTTIGQGSSDIRAAHGSASWATISDLRVKKDIETSTVGLAFINDLRPVTFNYKNKGDIPSEFNGYVEGSTEAYNSSLTQHGFIAQEVKAAIDKHSDIKDGFDMWDDDDSTGQQRVGEAALIPILVKAIQELKTELDAAKARITTLEG